MIPDIDNLAQQIDSLLPQTQCTRCGYESCRSYAGAMSRGEADINRCPPGGEQTLKNLIQLLNSPPIALDRERGIKPAVPHVATIVETDCIGCTKCIQVCPVDAIIGAAKKMHTVIPALCTGCELCIPACPVDCILLVPARQIGDGVFQHQGNPAQARLRYQARQSRLAVKTISAKSDADHDAIHDEIKEPQSALVLAAMEKADELFAQLHNQHQKKLR